MKRFTGTEKWDDPWFQDLTPELKLLWLYICDSCDCAGIWKMNQKLVNFRLGLSVDLDQAREQFGKRIHKIEPDKWFIIPFIRFQYGILNSDCRPHKPVISLVGLHDLNRVLEGYWKGINTLQEQDKEKDKEQDKDRGDAKGGKTPTVEQAAAHFKKMGADFSEAEIRSTILALNVTIRPDGFWAWGDRPATDWRSAMEKRMSDDRERKMEASPKINPNAVFFSHAR